MSVDDYNLLRKGYDKKREDTLDIVRTALARVLTPFLSSSVEPMDIWPLPKDAEVREQRRAESLKRLAAMKKISGFKRVGKKIVPIESS